MKLDDIFSKCLDISKSKRDDYASNPMLNPHENFQRSAEVASWFIDDRDKPYAILVATKLARLGSLLGRKLAKNESIEDTFLDLVNYCALWAEARTKPTVEQLDEILNGADNQTKAEALGKQIDTSIEASSKILKLAEELTNQHLIDIADTLYKMKARREHHQF